MSVIRCLLTVAMNFKTATPPVIPSEVEKSPGEKASYRNETQCCRAPFLNCGEAATTTLGPMARQT